MSNFTAPPADWSDIARLCRRVCVLRERGQISEAEKVRSELLPPLLAAVRAPADTDRALEERVNATFAAETERVANAAVLAELLRPLLNDGKAVIDGAAFVTPPAPAAPVVFAPVPPAPIPKPPVRAAASIADFIDEMIAQENPPERSGDSTRRRAS